MSVFDFILKILIIIALTLQIISIIYLIYINHKRDKEDKLFWKTMNESIKASVVKYNKLYPEEPLKLEEIENEQTKNQG